MIIAGQSPGMSSFAVTIVWSFSAGMRINARISKTSDGPTKNDDEYPEGDRELGSGYRSALWRQTNLTGDYFFLRQSPARNHLALDIAMANAVRIISAPSYSLRGTQP